MMQGALAPSSCEVVILTALPVEFQAVVAHLQGMREVVHRETGTVYQQGSFPGKQGTWRVAVAQIGMGGLSAATEAERASNLFHPRIMLFVGVAGGLKDVRHGDVVVATKVYAYESGKAAARFKRRPDLWHPSHALEQRARAEANDDAWLTRLGEQQLDSAPQVFLGPLAAGEKVLSDQRSSVYRFLQRTYGDSLAVEMEGHGFLQAVQANQQIHALVVRGISDLIDDKTVADAAGTQRRAARYAAAFAFQVLATFTLPVTDSSPSFAPTQPVFWNIPFARNPFFTGRDDLLEQLHTQLRSTRAAALGQHQAISGLGGIGKTQLALEYAYSYRQEYQAVLWVQAESTESFISSYVALAMLLQLPERETREQAAAVQAVTTWLQTHHDWLLILDNADEPDLLLSFLPRTSGGHILVTTRATDLSSFSLGFGHTLVVSAFDLEPGAQLLLHRAGLLPAHVPLAQARSQDRLLALELCRELGGLPLALDQAGAYLAATQMDLLTYQQAYQQHRMRLLADRRGPAHPQAVATTWSLSFQRVAEKNPAAADLLRLCAYLAPDAIPEEILTLGATFPDSPLSIIATDALLFNQAIEALLAYSLVGRDQRAHTLTVHRLVQAVLQDGMEVAEQSRWVEYALRAVNAVFPRAEHATWLQCERLLPQALVIIEQIERYQIMSLEATRLLDEAASYLLDRARYAEAESLYRQALRIKEEREPGHFSIAISLNGLANLAVEQGKEAEAEQLYEQALAIRERQLGSEDPLVALSLNNLATNYHKQGKSAEAEPLYQRALRIWEQQEGEESSNIAYPLTGLASLYRTLGKYTEAEELSQRALAIRERRLGPEHPLVASTLNNLAILYQRQGKNAEAKRLYQRALRILEQEAGPEHPDVAYPLYGLANLYFEEKEYAEAEPLYRRVLGIWERQLGKEHLQTQLAAKRYRLLLRAMGSDEEAKRPDK